MRIFERQQKCQPDQCAHSLHLLQQRHLRITFFCQLFDILVVLGDAFVSDSSAASNGCSAASTPGSVLRLSPDSGCARCSRATVRRSSSPVHVRYSPEPCAPAPVRLAPGSPSDRLALSRCDVSPDTATRDRSWPAGPGSAHPGDHPSFDSLRSTAPFARAPRSLRVPTSLSRRLTHGECVPVSSAMRLRAFPRTLRAEPWESCSPAAPAAPYQLRRARSTSWSDRPGPARRLTSIVRFFCSPSLLQC